MHCPLNYGAILQTYALQTYLESKDILAKVINYRPAYIVDNQGLMYVGADRYKRNIFTRWVYRILKAPSKIHRRRMFSRFMDREIHITSEFKTFYDICKAGLEADYFICGSDQIWNVASGAYKDPSYFLEFISDNRKKISYAASGNLPLTDDVKSITFPMISRIGHISMREDITIASIQPFIDKQINHVCDPVFLLDDDVWRSLYTRNGAYVPKEKYVLVYPMGNGGEATIEKAYQFSKELCLPLYMISASARKDSRASKKFNVDPYTFLSLFDNAEYIITNSFHGTSFSIILEKQFWSSVAKGSNQRITSLLSSAGLENRLLNDDEIPISYNLIDLKLAKQRLSNYIQFSKDFLKSSMCSENQSKTL